MNGWEWMKAAGGWPCDNDPPGRRIFHAYTPEGSCACEPGLCLGTSCEEPNEGSEFCPACMEIVVYGERRSDGMGSTVDARSDREELL